MGQKHITKTKHGEPYFFSNLIHEEGRDNSPGDSVYPHSTVPPHPAQNDEMFPSYTHPSTALQNQMPLYEDEYVTFLGETECRTLTSFGHLDLVIRRTSMNLSTNWTKPVDDCAEYIKYEGFDLPSQRVHMRGHG